MSAHRTFPRPLTLGFAAALAALCCTRGETASAAPGLQPAEAEPSAGARVRLRTLRYVDRQGIGIEAFSLLAPADWQFDGGITWVLDNPGLPARAAFRVKNPRGHEELEGFPSLPFFWSTNQLIISTLPPGSSYFGSEVLRPLGAQQALREIVLQRFRRDVADLRVVREQALPELAQALGAGGVVGPGVSSSADAAKIRVEYRRGGVWMEEEIYGVVERLDITTQSMYGPVTNTNWVVGTLFSFKAARGALDQSGRLFQTMAYSFRLNPQWFNKYTQLVNYLIQAQIKRIHAIGEISRMVARTHDEISDQMMQSYQQRQAVNDRIADNFSQYMRGVDAYQDPFAGRPVELPAGYRNAWANALGEYILTDDSGFNPNAGSNQSWQRLGHAAR